MIQDKWEGDVGDYVDAIAHDDPSLVVLKKQLNIPRGYWIGNNPNIQQTIQALAAFEQMRTIIVSNILTNTAYTTLQSPVVTTQTTNSNNGEAGSITKTGELIDISNEILINGNGAIPTNEGTGIVNITVTGHNLLARTKVTVTEVTGTTQLNGNSYYVDVVDANTLTLYKDSNLLSQQY